MRKTERLRDSWRFTRSESFNSEMVNPEWDDSGWEQVCVPHDWAAAGPFCREYDAQITKIDEDGENEESLHLGRTGGLPHVGKGVYRRRFFIPASEGCEKDKTSAWLEFDGVMSHARVFVNGKFVGARPYGYSSFCCDITDALRFDEENLLAVTVENPPFSSRWYPGAGIYRNVRLVVTDRVHIRPWGLRVRTEKIEGHDAFLHLSLETSAGDLPFEYTVRSPRGETILRGRGAAGEASFLLSSFEPWDIDAPNLYAVTATLTSGDSLTVRFGVRELRFDAEKGLFLNGRPIRMNGVCLHHDLGPLGAAFSRPAAARQLRKLRSIGANAIRTSHNPPDPGMLELCDEMGFLVIDEAFDAWRIAKLPNDYHTLFPEWAESDLCDMIRRDRNHPCVILWSIGNEIPEQREKEGWKVARALREMVRRMDPDRPVTAGLNRDMEAVENHFAVELDVPGFNYKPHNYARLHELLPGKPMYGSETASTVSSRGEYFFPVCEGSAIHPEIQSSSYDVEYPSWASTPDTEFRAQDLCPWIMGEFVWTGFDYLGEPTPYNCAWPSHSSYFGIFDLAGLPKDRAYLYRSRWSSAEPTLHLLPHWNFPNRIGKPTPVHCYTSFREVELFLNGKSLGRKSRADLEYRIRWDEVSYEPGELKAVAYAPDGSVAMECFRRTAGEAAVIRLELENTGPITADGEDLAFVHVTVCDREGNPHPSASHRVSCSLEGPGVIAAIGNGDPTCTESFRQHHFHVYNGEAVVYLRSRKGKPGTLTLTVTGSTLLPASLEVKSVLPVASSSMETEEDAESPVPRSRE